MEFKRKSALGAVLCNEAAKGRSSLSPVKRILNLGDFAVEFPIYVPFVKGLLRNLPAINIL